MTFKELQNLGYTIEQDYTNTQLVTDELTNLTQFDDAESDEDIAPESPDIQETNFDAGSSEFTLFNPSGNKQKDFDDLEELQDFVKSHSLEEIENELESSFY